MCGIDKKQLLMIVFLAGSIIFGVGYKLALVKMEASAEPVLTDKQTSLAPQKEKENQPKQITVYISGAVKKPGVYTFNEGARVIDGVNKAEAMKDAALEYINLAEPLTDGQQIPVPGKDDIQPATGIPNSQGGVRKIAGPGSEAKININTADKDMLDNLPGVGPSTAEKIVEYRSAHGRFKSVSDILKVPGIGEKKLAKFKEKIRV